jgi:hypothetical protein
MEMAVTDVNAKETARLHEIGDYVWALAKQFHREGRATPLTPDEISKLKTISSDLHGIAEARPRYDDADWTFQSLLDKWRP